MKLRVPQWYEAEDVWPAILPWVERALAHGRMAFTSGDILKDVLLRHKKLWLAEDGGDIRGFAVTAIETYPRRRCFVIVLIGGEGFKDWGFFIADMERYAKGMGCQEVCALGRLGWTRAALPFGYRPQSIVYRKVLEP